MVVPLFGTDRAVLYLELAIEPTRGHSGRDINSHS